MVAYGKMELFKELFVCFGIQRGVWRVGAFVLFFDWLCAFADSRNRNASGGL